MSILYISYDGLLEPLGKSQVLAYVARLAADRTFHLISFEKSKDLDKTYQVREIKRQLTASGIHWYPLRYHKSPTVSATAWDILQGILLGAWLTVGNQVTVVHARGYVASVIALVITRLTKTPFLFDMRGFWADEKLDGGWSQRKILYKTAKWFEKRFLTAADHVVSLTEAAVPIIRSFPYLQGRLPTITVIPTCADLMHFRIFPDVRRSQALTIGYVGTATNWYLFDKTAECFFELLRINPECRFLIVNYNEHSLIREKLKLARVPLSSVELRSADYQQMPQLMAKMHASIYFIKPVFSKKASSATKLGELLSCGIPCMTNWGIGDVNSIFEEGRIGVLLQSFEKSAMVDGLKHLLTLVKDPDIAPRCRAAAAKWFSLEEGIKRYTGVYNTMECDRRR